MTNNLVSQLESLLRHYYISTCLEVLELLVLLSLHKKHSGTFRKIGLDKRWKLEVDLTFPGTSSSIKDGPSWVGGLRKRESSEKTPATNNHLPLCNILLSCK
ncbi:hypothetical protein AVEN_172740-1 [Araneus ventricosus]|uniref:Uncharacterized protein n=1 Tax=Araneus ventricosus TaxID=182803 RepID=A0A4Y2BKC0_ARAVE|nr:hypothetical protein AVEN_172740-1 [Araneus ventricosus]